MKKKILFLLMLILSLTLSNLSVLAVDKQPPVDESTCDLSGLCTKEETTQQVVLSSALKARVALIDGEMRNEYYAKNRYNFAHDHSNPAYEERYAPGDLEFNYWGSNVNFTENYRVNGGVNFAIDNAKLVVTLPYTNVQELIDNGSLTMDMASQWLVDRLYAGNSDYDELVLTMPSYTVDGSNITFDFGSLAARTGYSIQFHRTFSSLEEYNALALQPAEVKLDGVWNLNNIQLPNTSEVLNVSGSDKTDEELIAEYFSNEQPVAEDGTVSGYVVHSNIEVVEVEDGLSCSTRQITKTITNQVDMNARAVMNTDLDDFANTGYEVKVYNANNHPMYTEALLGPGNAEVQHWQDGPNAATTKQFWRPVFATDYAIENAVITFTLPYELDLTKDSITNATEWLVTRYYPFATGQAESYYSDMTKVLGLQDVVSNLEINGNIVTLKLDYVPARSAISLVFTKNFDTPQDFNQNLQRLSFNVSGNYIFPDLAIPPVVTKTITDSCPCVVDLGVSKVWDDAENQDGLRPTEVTMTLQATAVTAEQKVVLNEENSWSHVFTCLPETDSEKNKINYVITEDPVEHYTTESSQVERVVVFTNTHIPETIDIIGQKIWVDEDNVTGSRPTTIRINLLADYVPIDYVEIEGNEFSFVGLPKYKDQGTLIGYTITEDAVEGYTTTIDGYIVTNTLIDEEEHPVITPEPPVDPTDPVDPVDPVDPTDPVNPVDPTDPVDPVNPTSPETLPQTGVSNQIPLYGLLMLLSGSLLVLLNKKKQLNKK